MIYVVLTLFFVIMSMYTFCQTPKQIVLHNSPVRIDSMFGKTIVYYKMFRVVVVDSTDSVIVKVGRYGRSIYVSPQHKKEILLKLKRK